MLRLQEIELCGFKSFVEPVRLSFGGGITAIVGPNGCGKSNTSDALTWVLGEQSAKSLRGSRMEDVIFSGSERRKPLGMAEVSLVLATDPAFPAAENGQVTISRRVFRSGESQYRLNGQLVRLKDIKSLLMDTGLGIRAYSVIEQGRIGMILSGKPQERRRLIEEAAGITRYKDRKRVAEVKLEDSLANLHRLDDIVSEVERSLRSLKRQANAAQRYQEREAEYRRLLEQVLLGRWSRIHATLSRLDAELAESAGREAELSAAITRDEAALAAGRLELEEMAKVVAERHERQSSLAERIEGRQELIKAARARRQEIGERIASSLSLASGRETDLARQREALATLEGQRGDLAAELERARSEVGDDSRRLAGAEEELAGASAGLEHQRSELLAAVGRINQLRSGLHNEQIELEKRNFRLRHLEEEHERADHGLKEATEAVALAESALAELRDRAEAKRRELEGVEAALDGTLRRENEASERRRAAEEALRTARQRRALLTELSAEHAEDRAGLEEVLAQAGLDRPSYLSELASAVPGWERSLDFFLGPIADAVVVEDDRETAGLLRRLAEGRRGASLLRALQPVGEESSPIDDPAVGLPLGEALGLPPAVAAALPRAYLVDRAEDAERLARRHPGAAFISPEQVWAIGGLVHVEGNEVRPGILERESELAELAERLPTLDESLAEAVREVEELIVERARRAEESNRLASALTQLHQEAAVAEARLQEADKRRRRLAEEHAAIVDERRGLDKELRHLSSRREELATALAAAESLHRSLEETFDTAQREVDAIKGRRENLRAETAGRRGRVDLLAERLAAHDRETERVRAEIADGEKQIALWKDEASRLERRLADTDEEIDRAGVELQGLLEEQAGSSDGVLQAQETLDRHRESIRELEGRLATARAAHDEARSAVEELRVARAEARHDASHLDETFREQFGQPLPEESAEEPADLAELETDLVRQKAVLERMGPVNALAVQEFAEQEERHEFLLTQRADIVDSIDSLRRTIREINQTSSERFRATFAEVNQSFSLLFEKLFRGGEAEMRLLDEEDILETGIEIVARPPGKRLQNIMLLSGGEKALTAIALLFALFRTKPSPFCILDEVDAPLDDANALRFVEMLREMAKETQFIIITHNKLTMQIAHTLYGVTMEERGVSSVVSVDLDDVQPQAEPAGQAVSA